MSSILESFLKGKSLLRKFPQPELEAKLLLLKSASISEEEFYANPDKPLTAIQEKEYTHLVSKRLDEFPLAYILGEKDFWSISFKVFPGVLIPRPETEFIVEKIVKLSALDEEIILDIGTGCGNIAISLAKELPKARIVATDISGKALKAARLNTSLQKASNLTFVRSDLFSSLKKRRLKGKCDFIASNPPYISCLDWEGLPQEIKDFEPKQALVAGETGLEVIKRLISEAQAYLKPGGYLIFEIGSGQKDDALELFGKNWNDVECLDDLSGIPRVIAACWQ